ncbi:hypothetical protein CDL12_28561 [Handroanthus impetiginosus]|uniref:Glabrous enhancer-binding protein-like DBD domain-containing protein n=1 Tax=Handroanthus impetiginosus TaxID=429701 RepID=A0A2G9G0U9_9LAMI|nr:hypothetical protein CDL12_28561 [Handroanthus impetiginosus]
MNSGSSSKSPSQPPSSSVKLFTEEDEINILRSLLNSAGNSYTAGQFSESQITHKIRRLKEKYHKLARTKSSIKTAHDRDIYEIGRQIWGKEKTRMPSPPPVDRERKEKASESSKEGAINWSGFPYMMKEVSRAFPGCEDLYKQGLTSLGQDILKGLEERWKALAEEEAAIQAKQARLFWGRLKSGGL